MKIKIKSNQMEEIEGIRPDYPYVYHHVRVSETKVPWHWHEELEFDYVMEGKGKLSTPHGSYLFEAGEAYFTNANVLSTLENIGECIIASHLFHPVFLGGHFKSIFEMKYLDPVLKDKRIDVIEIRGKTENQRKILRKLRQAAELQKNQDSEFQTRNIFSEIWLLLLKEIQTLEYRNTPAASVSQERLLTMLTFIQENYQRKITLEEIAAEASVSKRECLRCFQTCIHESPFEYLLAYRMEAAKRLLKTTDLPIIEIAMQTGFRDGAYFSKMFKKDCGKTPGTYRKMYQTADRSSCGNFI